MDLWNPKYALNALGSANADLDVCFLISARSFESWIALYKYATDGIYRRLFCHFSDVMQSADNGTIELPSHLIRAISWQRTVGRFSEFQKPLICVARLLDTG